MSVYRVTEIIGTSSTSWEDAAAEAIKTAAGTLRDLRVGEVVKQDIHLDEGGAITYRTKLQLSFKYESDHYPPVFCCCRSTLPAAAAGRGRAGGRMRRMNASAAADLVRSRLGAVIFQRVAGPQGPARRRVIHGAAASAGLLRTVRSAGYTGTPRCSSAGSRRC